MALFSKLSAVAVIAGLGVRGLAQSLVPQQDILLPASESASDPLKFLGANSPWFQGPNVYNISSDVPDGCAVEQASYVVRHGSRYPDPGAYNQWVALQEKIGNATFTATGSLSFIQDWEPVLKYEPAQISQESITGYKESYDLGYKLRVKYPDFYIEGTPFNTWANLYPRVVQTAKMFVRGYLGAASTTLGTVATVNSTGSAAATGNSLAPSDSCPLFDDDSGGDNATTFANVYLPSITDRINSMLSGNLTFEPSDVALFPYLCGFESQIVGKLSPWCGVFTDEELLSYEYAQDLRYYYGLGPGTVLEQQMMVPFLNSLVGILAEGPGVTGVQANGSSFTLPKLIMNFLNDGQIAELAAAIGVFDDQEALPADEVPADRTYVASHFVSMRGTVSFERLKCVVVTNTITSGSGSGSAASNSTISNSTTTADNSTSSNWTTSTTRTVQYNRRAELIESTTNETFIRVFLNDVAYPITACHDGPGSSCAMSDYVALVAERYAASGNWAENCNVTGTEARTVVKGASFLIDLGLDFVDIVDA